MDFLYFAAVIKIPSSLFTVKYLPRRIQGDFDMSQMHKLFLIMPYRQQVERLVNL